MNSTQVCGLLSFGIASLLCVYTSQRSNTNPTSWILLSACFLLLALEVLLGFRHGLHNTISAFLRSTEIYAERKSMQTMVLYGGLFVLTVAVPLFLFRMRNARSSLRLAALGLMLALFTFAIEMISLHAVDALLYKPFGPILSIGWIWAGCATLTTMAAVTELRRAQ